MGGDEPQSADAAPTAIAEASDYDAALSGEQTQLAPSSSETEANTAWALDDGEDWVPPFWTAGRITGVAATAAALLVAGAAVVGFIYLRDREDVQPVAQTPTSATISTIAPPPLPPPVTVTTVVVQPPPTTVTKEPPPSVSVLPTNPNFSAKHLQVADDEFIDRLRGNGWVITDADLLKMQGRQICVEFTSLGTPLAVVRQKLVAAGYSQNDAETMAAVAQIAYPECIPKS